MLSSRIKSPSGDGRRSLYPPPLVVSISDFSSPSTSYTQRKYFWCAAKIFCAATFLCFTACAQESNNALLGFKDVRIEVVIDDPDDVLRLQPKSIDSLVMAGLLLERYVVDPDADVTLEVYLSAIQPKSVCRDCISYQVQVSAKRPVHYRVYTPIKQEERIATLSLHLWASNNMRTIREHEITWILLDVVEAVDAFITEHKRQNLRYLNR